MKEEDKCDINGEIDSIPTWIVRPLGGVPNTLHASMAKNLSNTNSWRMYKHLSAKLTFILASKLYQLLYSRRGVETDPDDEPHYG